jgi:hypothetical protein
MKTEKYISLVLCLAIIIVGFTLIVLRCSSGSTPDEVIRIDTLIITKTDTIHRIVTEDRIVYRDRIIYRDIPANVDTAEILKDYFAVRYYEREIIEDNLKAIIYDSISQNKIAWSQFEYETYVDTVFVNIEKEITRTRYRTGFYVNVLAATKFAGAGISYQGYSGALYGVSPYFTADKDFGISFSLSIPLNQK